MVEYGDFMTIAEVMAATRRSRQWIYSRIADGTFRVRRSGRSVWIQSIDVATWMSAVMMELEETFRHYEEHIPT